MTTEHPVRDREQLHYLLAEAAEIEHDLMCCYLYAAFSLKDERDELRPNELEAVGRWRREILAVAIEEMTHLSLVSNLLTSIGGSPHFGRQNFPISPGVHPAGIVLQLARFDRATLDHFVFLERPEGVDLPDGSGFAPPLAYVRGTQKPGLMPNAVDFATVGRLYGAIRQGFDALAQAIGESKLFMGDPDSQVGTELIALPGMQKVTDLESAHAAIDVIVTQGEGAPGHTESSHFSRFLRLRDEFDALTRERPDFAPARPAAKNPVMRRPPFPEGRVWVTAPGSVELVDLANAVYTFSLRLLAQGFGWAGEAAAKGVLLDGAIAVMQAMGMIASELTRMPAEDPPTGVNAGMTFALLRAISPLPHGGSEWAFLGERARELADACATLSTASGAGVRPLGQGATIARAASILGGVATSLEVVRVSAASATAPSAKQLTVIAAAPPSQSAATPLAAAPGGDAPGGGTAFALPPGPVEIAESEGVSLHFEGRRCIHARHCVLGEPDVFLANVVGPWLHPEKTSVEDLMRVAQACPSGAITLSRKDGGPDEAAPHVNVARIRENGPYAIHAEIALEGEPARLRATLCRCGLSKKKPFCDASHVGAFVASGEPATIDATALASRDGTLSVRPLPNGPLQVRGNVEICAGTGRTVLRTTGTHLCRCGGSATKPICDGTHARIGFRSDV